MNVVPPLKVIVTGGMQSTVIGRGGYGIHAETRKMRKECLRQRGIWWKEAEQRENTAFPKELRKVL